MKQEASADWYTLGDYSGVNIATARRGPRRSEKPTGLGCLRIEDRRDTPKVVRARRNLMRRTNEDRLDADAASPGEISDRVVTDHPDRAVRRDGSRRLEEARVRLLKADLGRRHDGVEPASESESLDQGREFRNVVRDDHVPPSAVAQKRQDRFNVVEDPVPLWREDAFPQSHKRAREVRISPAKPDKRISEAVVDSVPPSVRRCQACVIALWVMPGEAAPQLASEHFALYSQVRTSFRHEHVASLGPHGGPTHERAVKIPPQRTRHLPERNTSRWSV